MSLEPGTRLGSLRGPRATRGCGRRTVQGHRHAAESGRDAQGASACSSPRIPRSKRGSSATRETISSSGPPTDLLARRCRAPGPATDFVVTEYSRARRSPSGSRAAARASGSVDAGDRRGRRARKAHRQGVTHGGLNPSVVLLTPVGPEAARFRAGEAPGRNRAPRSSRDDGDDATLDCVAGVGAAVAAAYTAPEQFAGAEADARSDIFAFGAILYEMVDRPAGVPREDARAADRGRPDGRSGAGVQSCSRWRRRRSTTW